MSTKQKRYADENPIDTVDRKLAQAHSLAFQLYGGGGESFRSCNDTIQDNVCWLLADLITDIREALDEVQEKARIASAG